MKNILPGAALVFLLLVVSCSSTDTGVFRPASFEVPGRQAGGSYLDFIAIGDTGPGDADQLAWLERTLDASTAEWTCTFAAMITTSKYSDQQAAPTILVSGAGSRLRSTSCGADTVYTASELGFLNFRVSAEAMVVCVVHQDAEIDFCHVVRKKPL